MTGTRFNLLQDPLIEIEQGTRSFVNLPDVLERLGNDQDIEFPGLQAHHQHPWHTFLVQLAGLALHKAGLGDPALSASRWKALLLDLEPNDSAWCLVTDDLKEPAFLQPPVPEGNLSGLKNKTRHPDKLDVLVTAKNHEVKAATIDAQEPLDSARQVLPILLTLQTFSGFSGRGNYGIARMNGGFGSRPAVYVTPHLRWATRFRRDLRTLLRSRDDLIDDIGYAEDQGHGLLWVLPWGGTKGEILHLEDLDPFFIEICRRVRLTLEDGLTIHYGSTQAGRVDAKDRLGNMGDPWTPIRQKDLAALTLSERGFHYRLVTELLFPVDTYTQAPTQTLEPGEPANIFAVFTALVGGQGKTGGYHERILEIPSKCGRIFYPEDRTRFELAKRAQARIETVSDMRRKVLKPALLALAQGGTEQKLNMKDDRADPWLNRFEHEVDRAFFPMLFDDIPEEDSERQWQKALRSLAHELFTDATHVLPGKVSRNPITIVQAESLFHFKAKEVLPKAFPSAEYASQQEGN